MKEQTANNYEKLLTTDQVAEILNLSPRTLEGYRHKGSPEPGLPFVKYGRAVRYRESDVLKFRDARVRASTSDNGADATG